MGLVGVLGVVDEFVEVYLIGTPQRIVVYSEASGIADGVVTDHVAEGAFVRYRDAVSGLRDQVALDKAALGVSERNARVTDVDVDTVAFYGVTDDVHLGGHAPGDPDTIGEKTDDGIVLSEGVPARLEGDRRSAGVKVILYGVVGDPDISARCNDGHLAVGEGAVVDKDTDTILQPYAVGQGLFRIEGGVQDRQVPDGPGPELHVIVEEPHADVRHIASLDEEPRGLHHGETLQHLVDGVADYRDVRRGLVHRKLMTHVDAGLVMSAGRAISSYRVVRDEDIDGRVDGHSPAVSHHGTVGHRHAGHAEEIYTAHATSLEGPVKMAVLYDDALVRGSTTDGDANAIVQGSGALPYPTIHDASAEDAGTSVAGEGEVVQQDSLAVAHVHSVPIVALGLRIRDGEVHHVLQSVVAHEVTVVHVVQGGASGEGVPHAAGEHHALGVLHEGDVVEGAVVAGPGHQPLVGVAPTIGIADDDIGHVFEQDAHLVPDDGHARYLTAVPLHVDTGHRGRPYHEVGKGHPVGLEVEAVGPCGGDTCVAARPPYHGRLLDHHGFGVAAGPDEDLVPRTGRENGLLYRLVVGRHHQRGRLGVLGRRADEHHEHRHSSYNAYESNDPRTVISHSPTSVLSYWDRAHEQDVANYRGRSIENYP